MAAPALSDIPTQSLRRGQDPLRALAPGRFSFQGFLAFFRTGMMTPARTKEQDKQSLLPLSVRSNREKVTLFFAVLQKFQNSPCGIEVECSENPVSELASDFADLPAFEKSSDGLPTLVRE